MSLQFNFSGLVIGSRCHFLTRSYFVHIRELKQPRRRRQQKPHKFAYLTLKKSIFARFARAFFSFWHFEDVLVLSTTWNDLFCSCVYDVSIRWQMLIFVFLCPKRWFQINSRTVRRHFSIVSHIFRFWLPSTSCLLKLPIYAMRTKQTSFNAPWI